jgi:hypothetical protein
MSNLVDEAKYGFNPEDCMSMEGGGALAHSEAWNSTTPGISVGILTSSEYVHLASDAIADNDADLSESRKSWKEYLRDRQSLYDEDDWPSLPNKMQQQSAREDGYQYAPNDGSGFLETLQESQWNRELWPNDIERNNEHVLDLETRTEGSVEPTVISSVSSGVKCKNANSELIEHKENLMDLLSEWTEVSSKYAALRDHLNSSGEMSACNALNSMETIWVDEDGVGALPLTHVSVTVSNINSSFSMTSRYTLGHRQDEIIPEVVTKTGSDCVEELTSGLNISGTLDNVSDLDDSLWDPGSDSVDTEVDDLCVTDHKLPALELVPDVAEEQLDNLPKEEYVERHTCSSINTAGSGVSVAELELGDTGTTTVPSTTAGDQLEVNSGHLPLFSNEASEHVAVEPLTTVPGVDGNCELDLGLAAAELEAGVEDELAQNRSRKCAKMPGSQDKNASLLSPRLGKSRHRLRRHADKKEDDHFDKSGSQTLVTFADVSKDTSTPIAGKEDTSSAVQLTRSSSYSKAVDLEESGPATNQQSQSAVVPRHSSYLRAIDGITGKSVPCEPDINEAKCDLKPLNDSDEVFKSKGLKKVDERQEKKHRSKHQQPATIVQDESPLTGNILLPNENVTLLLSLNNFG